VLKRLQLLATAARCVSRETGVDLEQLISGLFAADFVLARRSSRDCRSWTSIRWLVTPEQTIALDCNIHHPDLDMPENDRSRFVGRCGALLSLAEFVLTRMSTFVVAGWPTELRSCCDPIAPGGRAAWQRCPGVVRKKTIRFAVRYLLQSANHDFAGRFLFSPIY